MEEETMKMEGEETTEEETVEMPPAGTEPMSPEAPESDDSQA